jgi:hypothetical protein
VVTPAVSRAEFFERLFAIERAAAGMFARLAVRLERIPELAAQARGLEQGEWTHLELLGRFRDALPAALLAGPCDAASVRQLDRVDGLLEGDPVARFADFEEAYQFIHEFEYNDLVPLLRLLDSECRTERLDCSPIMLIVEQHLARMEKLADSAGNREHRRAIRI